MKFEWDTEKEKSNIQKHGVSFEQASYVFADPFALNKYDDDHSHTEDMWILLEKSLSGVILVVVYTFRDNDGAEFARIISAGKATNRKKHVPHRRGDEPRGVLSKVSSRFQAVSQSYFFKHDHKPGSKSIDGFNVEVIFRC